MTAKRQTKQSEAPAPLLWLSPLSDLPRITPARLRALHDAGLVTVHDLLRHYPRRHEDRKRFPSFPASAGPDPLCLRGTVTSTKASYFGRRMQFTLTLTENSGQVPAATVQCRWFNLRYLSKILTAGQDLIIHGRPRALKKGGIVFDHPDFEILETDAPDSALIHLNRITPTHPSIGPWSPRMLRRLIFEILAQLSDESIPQLWPDPPVASPSPATNHLTSAHALRAIHFPETWEALESARAHLAREELFEMQCVLARQRARQTAGPAPTISRQSPMLAQFLNALPFDLTTAQKKVLAQIFDDLATGHPMNRLLHGDVGSGKTIVAATAMLGAISSGKCLPARSPRPRQRGTSSPFRRTRT